MERLSGRAALRRSQLLTFIESDHRPRILARSAEPARTIRASSVKPGEPLLDVGTLGEPGDYVFCRISPDGRRIVAVIAGRADIWLLETARGVASRLTSRGIHISPVWSPDGRTILFATGTPFNVYRMSADGSGREERLLESENRQVPVDWSKDWLVDFLGEFTVFV